MENHFELEHIGINMENETEAQRTCHPTEHDL